MSFVNHNGRIRNKEDVVLPYANSAFRYGTGLIETMLVKEGRIRLETYHWRRLFAGMQQLGFIAPQGFTENYLREEILRTVAKNGYTALCRVRLQVFAGMEGLYDPSSLFATFLVECYPIDAPITQLNEHGLVCGIATAVRKSADTLSALKTSNMLCYTQAAKEAKQQQWNDALILNHAGHIIESTIANIFWVKEHRIYTPALTEGCVAGVMRAFLLEHLPHEIVEARLAPETLAAAEEVFLTNAIRGIKWIKEIGNSTYTHDFIREIRSFIAI